MNTKYSDILSITLKNPRSWKSSCSVISCMYIMHKFFDWEICEHNMKYIAGEIKFSPDRGTQMQDSFCFLAYHGINFEYVENVDFNRANNKKLDNHESILYLSSVSIPHAPVWHSVVFDPSTYEHEFIDGITVELYSRYIFKLTKIGWGRRIWRNKIKAELIARKLINEEIQYSVANQSTEYMIDRPIKFVSKYYRPVGEYGNTVYKQFYIGRKADFYSNEAYNIYCWCTNHEGIRYKWWAYGGTYAMHSHIKLGKDSDAKDDEEYSRYEAPFKTKKKYGWLQRYFPSLHKTLLSLKNSNLR